MYQERFSAVRKLFFEGLFILFIGVLLLGGALMTWGGHTAGQPPDVVRISLSVILFLVSLLFIFMFCVQLSRMRTIGPYWQVQVDRDRLVLDSPDPDDLASFEYEVQRIHKLSLEAYEDDGTHHQWFVYLGDEGHESKEKFDLGPFSEEKVADKMQQVCGIKVYEVNLAGVSREWRYSFEKRIGAFVSALLAALIFASFLLPLGFYLASAIGDFFGLI